mgnify:CR=1 FL=1
MDKSEKEKQILDLLMSRKDIRKLVEKSNECYSKMDFVGAMKYRKEIDRESKIMLTKSESLVSLMNNADNEYKFNMLVWLHSMMCMADVFNGILEDFKDGVRKANGNSKFIKFDNLDRLMMECKKEIDYLMKGTSKSFQISFAVRSDEMREVIENMVGDNIREGYDMFKEEAKMTKETDRSKIEEFNKKLDEEIKIRKAMQKEQEQKTKAILQKLSKLQEYNEINDMRAIFMSKQIQNILEKLY